MEGLTDSSGHHLSHANIRTAAVSTAMTTKSIRRPAAAATLTRQGVDPEEVEAAMCGLLDPELRETYLGKAEIRAIFDMGKRNFTHRSAGSETPGKYHFYFNFIFLFRCSISDMLFCYVFCH